MLRLLLVSVLVVAAGCGASDGLQRGSVEGRVTLDGEPIAYGTIAFYPTAGTKAPSGGAVIENGYYAIGAARGPLVGRYRVEIRSSRKTGRRVRSSSNPNAMIDETVEIVPECYNAKSTLEKEIRKGKNSIDFPLVSNATANK